MLALGSRPIKNMIDFVESFGIAVIVRDLGSDAQDGVSLDLPERLPLIIVNTAILW
jgi:hypothetical protein